MESLTTAEVAIGLQVVAILSKAMPELSAIAFAGNAGQESRENPIAVQLKEGAKYLFQWEKDRLTGPDGVEAWCTANHLDVTTVAAQCAFVIHEAPTGNGMGSHAPLVLLPSARSLATLTADVCLFYERAGKPMLDNRIAFAKQLQAAMAASTPTPAPTPTPVGITLSSAELNTIKMLIDVLLTLITKGVLR